VVTGMGKSGLVGKKIAATMASTGTPSFFLHPAEGSHGDLGMVTRGDVAVALSNSGETEEIIRLLPVLRRMDIKVVSIVGNMESTLARRSDVALDASVSAEACPLGLAPTASTTATLAMGDALAMVVLDRRGFGREDFAMFHPGGSLGKRLLLTVSDLMHRDSDVPVVGNNVRMRDAMFEISSKRLGMTTVADDDGAFIGIITDGDLRRGLEKWGTGYLAKLTGEVMTKSPRTIGADALAAEALTLMERHSITSIVVMDDGGRACGVLHLHDLLKAGIV
jgi:arabinose-5-phosphate isomerase